MVMSSHVHLGVIQPPRSTQSSACCGMVKWLIRISADSKCNYLRQGGYVFAGFCFLFIMAPVRAEWRDYRSHWSPLPIYRHLLSSLSHLWTPSEARRQSTSSQGTPQLRQVVSGTPPRPYMETSSRSSTWQVDRPAPKRQQPPTCWSMEAGYQAWSWRKSDATVQRLRDYLTWPVCLCVCVSKITQKVMDGSFWNFERMSGMA